MQTSPSAAQVLVHRYNLLYDGIQHRFQWNRTVHVLGLIGLFALLGCATTTTQPHKALPLPYAQVPLSFEANQGQTDPQVQFLARAQGYNIFLTATEAVFAFNPSTPPLNGSQSASEDAEGTKSVSKMPSTGGTVIRMQLVGSNPDPQVEGADKLPGKVNYFHGNNPEQWLTNVPTYKKVKYAAVYPGVDLVYYGHLRQLEYDFIIAPGADPASVTLRFEGSDGIELDEGGGLVLSSPCGPVRLQKPVIYQQVKDGHRQSVDGGFVRIGSREVGFSVAAYDPALPLIIDPVLTYSTYLGGSGEERVAKPAVDLAGSIYLAGTTLSSDFPTANAIDTTLGGGWDAFVAKLTPDGSALVYATYLGGSGGLDSGFGIAVDATGAAYVTGNTHSADFPVINALQATLRGIGDAFVTKITPDGSGIAYSTYLGGSGDERAPHIAVDGTGAAYLAGGTTSSDFPTARPLQSNNAGGLVAGLDVFIAKITPDGSGLTYATYLGGSGDDWANGIALDNVGAVYITGDTWSDDFPTANALQGAPARAEHPQAPKDEVFVAKLTADGSALVYSTYLGGIAWDEGVDIVVDSDGAAYVAGYTYSADFPTAKPLQAIFGGHSDAFVAKLTPDGSALAYATFLGGQAEDIGIGIGIDAGGAAYVTGYTFSVDFPTVDPLQSTLNGELNAFVAKLTADGSALVYSTYLGGSFFDQATGMVVDPAGTAYITGLARSIDFPTTANALQSTFGGGFFDAFVAKIAAPTSPPIFAGTPGKANCRGQSVSALARQYGGLNAAASALGFSSVRALQDAIRRFCEG